MNPNISRAQVAVATKDSKFRASVTAALHSDPSLNLIGEISDEAGLFSLARGSRPDLLILDLALASRMNGAASSWPSTRIILLANIIDREHVLQALRLGARGIVPNTSPPQVLLKSIRTVMADEYWLDADALAMLLSMTRELLVGRSEHLDNEYVKLTQRELSVIAMIAGGCSNKEIGQQLSISERTVKHHLTNIFEKLGVSSRLQLANLAGTHGLIAATEPVARPQRASNRFARGTGTTAVLA
jgi:two-component system nitrate/nitrite response regulator NarL